MRKKRETQYVTIKEVAQHADVSIATVSRVLNNGQVRPERKRRVLEAMKELNYTPNNSARNLASVNATKRVSLVVPSLSSFYMQLIDGFKNGLSLYKYEGVIEPFNNDENEFNKICSKQEANAEVRGIVQFAPKADLINKIVVSILEENEDFKYNVSGDLATSKVGLYFPNDKYISDFFEGVVFSEYNGKAITLEQADDYPIIITHQIDTAFELINRGYKGIIRTAQVATNVSVAHPNIKTLDFDLYALGIVVARTVIKDINEEEVENTSIEIKVQ